jgi:hypothetical protein
MAAQGSAAPSGPPPDAPAPAAPLTPVGVGKADPQSLARAPAPEPGSLDDLIGRRQAPGAVPWTRAVWLLLMASVPIVSVGAYSLSREARRQRARGPGGGGDPT